MSWLLLTSISVFFRSIYGVMSKILSIKSSVGAYTQSALLAFFAGIISVIVSPLLGGINILMNRETIILYVIVATSQGLGNILYFIAMQNLTSGTAQISFSSILVFNTILSVFFLSLHLSFINVIGIFLLMMAILLAISGKVEFNLRGVLFMIFAAFLFSIFQLSTSKLSSQVTAATYLFIAYFGSFIVILIVKGGLVMKEITTSQNINKLILIPLLTAIPSLGNFIFAYYAYRIAPQPAKVAMLLTSQVVFGVILSYFFLKEKQNLVRKIIAAIFVFISAVLIKS